MIHEAREAWRDAALGERMAVVGGTMLLATFIGLLVGPLVWNAPEIVTEMARGWHESTWAERAALVGTFGGGTLALTGVFVMMVEEEVGEV